MSDDEQPIEGVKRKWADADINLKWAVIAEMNLSKKDIESNMSQGARNEIMERFGISSSAMSRWYTEWKTQRELAIVPDLSVKRSGKCGVSNLLLTEPVIDAMFELSFELKGDYTYEGFTEKFNEYYDMDPKVSVTTMWRWFKKLEVVETIHYIKPALETRHLIRRLDFVLNKLEPAHGLFRIKDQSRHVHIDEKWFYAVRERRKLYLFPGQQFRRETTRHKCHIIKVMFLAAVGMPQRLADGVTWFDGKIGIFPVVQTVQAKRNSKNRPAGADVIENVSMTAVQYRHMMEKPGGVLDTIKQKMHWAKNDNIVIQHDGAPGHFDKVNKVQLPLLGVADGWNITFDTQPAQSPDTNLCDLCFFNSLQRDSFKIRSKSNTQQELMDTVQEAWNNYEWEALERAWGHLFAVYRAILDDKGGNQYEKPHSDVTKRQLAGAGTLDSLVSMDTYLNGMEARDALDNAP